MSFLDFLYYVSALAAVVTLILGVGIVLRRFSPGGRSVLGRRGRLGIQEVMVIDQRRRLVLVRWDGREYLLATGPGNDFLVDGNREIPEEIVQLQSSSVSPSFGGILDQVMRRSGTATGGRSQRAGLNDDRKDGPEKVRNDDRKEGRGDGVQKPTRQEEVSSSTRFQDSRPMLMFF